MGEVPQAIAAPALVELYDPGVSGVDDCLIEIAVRQGSNVWQTPVEAESLVDGVQKTQTVWADVCIQRYTLECKKFGNPALYNTHTPIHM